MKMIELTGIEIITIGEHHYLFLHTRVPMIFDWIIRTPYKVLCHLSPAISKLFVKQEKKPFLFFRPAYLFDIRVKVIMPTLTTLLAYTPR